jgi:hypothetical protein
MQIYTLYSMVYEPDMTAQDRITPVTDTWCGKMSASKDHCSLALNFPLHCFRDSSTASAALSNKISLSVEAASLQLGSFSAPYVISSDVFEPHYFLVSPLNGLCFHCVFSI